MKARQGNYELMRVVAAVMIILNHISIATSKNPDNLLAYINKYLVLFFHLGGKFGVNLFVLLGAWFIYDKPLRSKQIIRLIVDVVVYGTVMNIVASIFFGANDIYCVLKSYSYWFPFAYSIFLLSAPLIHRLCEKDMVRDCIIVIGTVLFSAITFLDAVIKENYVFNFLKREIIIGPIWFVFILVVVNAVRMNTLQFRRKWLYLAIWIASYIVMYIALIFFGSSSFRDMYSPLCFISALSAFAFFSCLNIQLGGFLRRLAKSSFGPYLVQCNNRMRLTWNDELFKYTDNCDKVSFYFVVIVSVVFYFTFAICVDVIKEYLIRKRNE